MRKGSDMRLATVCFAGAERIGAVENGIVRLLAADVGDMVSAIAAGRLEIERQISLSKEAAPLAAVRIAPPIRRFSRDVLCTGWNYWDHYDETKGKREAQNVERPTAPTFFTKSPHTIIGPYDDIGYDSYVSAKWDYEAEIGLVIGKRCRSVSRAEAASCVFGYFLANDISQRDLQSRHGGQWLKGKSIDGTMPIGPFIVTPDEFDLRGTRLQLHLNGERMQDALVAQMAFDIPTLISELSFGMTLDVGDVLITGTPAGIGSARQPAIFLKEGDEILVSAPGLGELRNRLVAANLHGTTDLPRISG